jgi:hypothetical protein|tara:strand:+ start:307 stop:471 length:165 start_codon:yes stop_codon:yes gene_type:complete
MRIRTLLVFMTLQVGLNHFLSFLVLLQDSFSFMPGLNFTWLAKSKNLFGLSFLF